jgi:DNA-binding SARP family transcriptional activator/tetratricopeptide (TPR) repeat protein
VPHIAILGSLVVRGAAGPVEVTGPRRRALLIRLVLSANEVVPTGELIEDLWGQKQPRTVVKSLQVQIGQLRRQLSAVATAATIVTRGAGYSLEVDRDLVDAGRFERLVREGRRANAEGRPVQASRRLHDGLRLWRGRALVDVENEPFAQGEIARLEGLRVVALEEGFEADLARGAHRDIITELESYLHVHGLRERGWGQLMVAYYRSGRQADALRAYQRACATLVEVGLEPGSELRALERQILDQEPSPEWRPAPTHVLGERSLGPAASSSGGGRPDGLPLPAAADVRSSIVGRDDPLRLVAARWERARQEQRQLLLVEGDPGIGKSRFVAEAAARVSRSGGIVLWGRCDENPTNPYQPFTEALDHLLRWTTDDQAETLVGGNGDHLVPVIPGLTERLGGTAPPVFHNSDHDRILVLDAVAAVLGRLVEHAPVLLVIEDLHFAASQTVHLLRHWLRQSRLGSTMSIWTYRLAELDQNWEVRSLLADVVGDPGTATVGLDDLSVADLEALVRESGPSFGASDPAMLARLLHRRTGGNPLLATQLLRAIADATPAHRDELMVATGTEHAGHVGVPSTVRLLVRQRTDRLSADAFLTLQVASVMGIEFDIGVLQTVLGSRPAPETASDAGPLDLLPALEALVHARLIDERADGTQYCFAHSLVRDSIYSDLSALRRARLHHRLADALVGSAHPAPVIAHHYRLAVLDGACAPAVEWLERAVLDHMGRFAYDDAQRALLQAIALVESASETDRSVRARLRLLLARCTEMLGNRAASQRHAEEAAADARISGSTEILVHAAIQRAGFAQPDSFDDAAVALFQQALDAVGEGRPDLRALVLSRAALSKTLVLGPSLDTDALGLEALALARACGDERVHYAALAAFVMMSHSGSGLEEQRALLAEMAEIERSPGIDVGASHGPFALPIDSASRLRNEAMSRLRSGDVESFDRMTEEIAALGRTRRDWLLLAIAEASRALRALLDGRFHDVSTHVDEMNRVGGNDHNIGNYMNGLRFVLAREVGELHQFEPWLTALQPRTATASIVSASIAGLYLYTGRPDAAYRVVDDFLPLELDSLTRIVPPAILAVFAEVCCHAHDTTRAAQLYDRLIPYAGEMLVLTWTYTVAGATDRYLGLLAGALGRSDEAEERFAAAVRFEESLPSPPLVVRSKASWGGWLLGREEEAQRRRGRELLDDAVTEATRIGMAPIALPDVALGRRDDDARTFY